MTIPLTDAETLSRLFHLNSEPWANAEAYREAADYEVHYKEVDAAAETILPEADGSHLQELLRRRESCRGYQLKQMPLQTLATMLKCGYGIMRTAPLAKLGGAYFRAVPSAGGLFPLEIYTLAREVETLADGIYHYNLRRHAVELVRPGDWFEELDRIMVAAPFIRNANLIFFLSAVFSRTQKKYGPRGYRYILLEAGHVAQNLCLAAAEYDLGSLCMGGYTDSQLNRFLEFDGVTEAVVYAVAAGYPA